MSFNSTLQLINDISRLIAKQLLHFFRIPITPSASGLSKNLALYLKDLKLLSLAISALKLGASSFE